MNDLIVLADSEISLGNLSSDEDGFQGSGGAHGIQGRSAPTPAARNFYLTSNVRKSLSIPLFFREALCSFQRDPAASLGAMTFTS